MVNSEHDLDKILDAWITDSGVILYTKNWMEVYKFKRILFFRLGTETSSYQQISHGDDLLITDKDNLAKVKTCIRDLLAKYFKWDETVPFNLLFAYGTD